MNSAPNRAELFAIHTFAGLPTLERECCNEEETCAYHTKLLANV